MKKKGVISVFIIIGIFILAVVALIISMYQGVIPKPGFLRNEADSVAAHSFSVAAFSYLFSRELKSNGIDIDSDKVLKLAMFHDMGEAITGDIGTFVKSMAKGVFDKVETEAFNMMFRNMTDNKEYMGYLEEYQKLESKESQTVKIADALDALAQGLSTPGANMDDLKLGMAKISKEKIKDKELSKIFLDCVNMMVNKEVTYFRGHFDKEDTSQQEL
mgnify:CR=1 FL=1